MSIISRIGATNQTLQPLNAARQARDVASELGDIVTAPLTLRERFDVCAAAGTRHEDAFALQLADRVVNRDLGNSVRLPKFTQRGQLRAHLVLTVSHTLPDVLGDLLVKRGRVVSADHASKVTANALVCAEALTSQIAPVHPSAQQGNIAHLYERHLPMDIAPTHSDLADIEAEWPLIAAEIAVVDAECRLALAPADVLAIRAHRRAVRAVLAALAQHASHHEPATGVVPLAPATRTPLLASGTTPVAA